MTEHKSIADALAAAQTEMGRAIKDSNNPHFRSKYADLGNVMDACMPALNKNGIAVYQPTGQDDYGMYVETVLLHVGGQELRCRVPLIVGKNDMQGFGSAVTYARRYGLMAMAGIAPEDDDGHAATQSQPARQQQQQRPAQSQVKQPEKKERDPQAIADGIIKAINECGEMDAIKALFGADTRASAAWDWLALEAPEQSQRVNEAKAAREDQLTLAPF